MKFFWLNFHLPYACRHSGACCTAGWPIPIELERAVLISKGEWLDEGGVLPPYQATAPPPCAGRCNTRAVLHAEIDRACRLAARPLDETLLREAIRAADLWLVHRADSNHTLVSV